jgi:two-component system phosphate regulon sensor histidine kinase PhoR
MALAVISGALIFGGGLQTIRGPAGPLALILTVVALIAGLYIYDRERVRKPEAAPSRGKVFPDGEAAQAFLEVSPDGVLIVDQGRVVVQMNPSMVRISETPLEEGLGSACHELFNCHTEDGLACGAVCPFERVLVTGDPVPDATIRLERNGATKWLAGSFARSDTASGQTVVIGSVRNITKSKEMEELQNDFVSIVSHELRGPLTAIKGFVQTLLRKMDEIPANTRIEFLTTINEQADYLNQLVEDLLNVSRIEAKRLKTETKIIDLGARVEKLTKDFQPKWGDRKVIVSGDPDVPPVKGDAKKVDEILINLIDNAIKYSPDGGEVRVSMVRDGDFVEVSVEDSGIGIAPEDAARLFQKFHRVSTPETRDIGGTGLGLYIVKNLVEAHGGRIWLQSAPGVGTTFTFTLPVSPANR